jgi:hypothetical protein
MATDSSSTSAIPTSFSIFVAEKLTKTNYKLWCTRILSTICAAQLEDLLTSTDEKSAKTVPEKTGNTVVQKDNLDYVRWVTHHQALLGYLLSSLTREIFMGVTILPPRSRFGAPWRAWLGRPLRRDLLTHASRWRPPRRAHPLWWNST